MKLTYYAPLSAVRGIWRCSHCTRAIWMTGRPVEGCTCEGCGTTASGQNGERDANA